MTYTNITANPKHRPWKLLTDRLLWLYGPERTTSILRGWDESTETDLRKWRHLGGNHVAL